MSNTVYSELSIEEHAALTILLARYEYQCTMKLNESVHYHEDQHTLDLLDLKVKKVDDCLAVIRNDLCEKLIPYKPTTK